jgi:outer membrane biogenesis lipoprotein LolB
MMNRKALFWPLAAMLLTACESSKFSAVEMRCKDKRIFENHQKASLKC